VIGSTAARTIAAALTLRAQAPAPLLAHLPAALAAEVRALLAGWSALARAGRAEAVAAAVASVRSPVPAGTGLIHPARRGVLLGEALVGAGDAAAVWAQRRACAGLVAMPAATSELTELADLAGWTGSVEWALVEVGLLCLAGGLATVGTPAVARVAAALGPGLGRRLVEAASWLAHDEARARALGPARVLLERIGPTPAGWTEADAMRTGLIGLLPALGRLGGDVARQVTQRLPPRLVSAGVVAAGAAGPGLAWVAVAPWLQHRLPAAPGPGGAVLPSAT